MATPIRQLSFAGGELSPTLYSRSDLTRYGQSARRLRNFFVSRQGAAVSRPGTTYVINTKTVTTFPSRLIPFVYSDTLSFVLEVGQNYIRFINNGVRVQNVFGGPMEIATSYSAADVRKLKFAQQGAVLTLTHPSYPPAELRYLGPELYDWTFTNISFDRPPSGGAAYLHEPLPVADGTHTAVDWVWMVSEVWRDSRGEEFEKAPTAITHQGIVYGAPWNSAILYAIGTKATDGGTQYRSVALGNLNKEPGTLGGTGFWVVDGTGSSPAPIQLDTLPGQIAVYSDRPVTIVFGSGYANALVDPSFIGYRIYRGRGSTFGWIGDTKVVNSFVDYGAAPDYSQQPPQGTNPFALYDNTGHLTSTEYPAVVTFHEQRRVFGRTNTRQGYLWASVVGDYANFDTRRFPVADESLTLELATRKLEEIRFAVGMEKLLVGTNSAIWAVEGASGPLSGVDLNDAKKQLEIGSSWVDPVVIDDGLVLFVRTKGSGVRSMLYNFASGRFISEDLSVYASHFFLGHQVVEWAHAEDPWGLVWAVREDGTLLSLTFSLQQQQVAWTSHDTDGTYVSVCAVPEGLEDAVYLIVQRTIRGVPSYFIERMASRVFDEETDPQDVICLDSACTFDVSPYPASTFGGVGGLDHLEGKVVWGIADGVVVGPYTVTGGYVTLTTPAQRVTLGLLYQPELETLDLASPAGEVKTREKTVVRVGIEVDTSLGLFAGEDFDHLTELKQRQVSDGYGQVPFGGQLYRMNVKGKWSTEGRVAIRQTAPLPLTVYAVTREVEFGDP